MYLRVSKAELRQLILWGSEYERHALEVGVPFQEDERKLLRQLRLSAGE